MFQDLSRPSIETKLKTFFKMSQDKGLHLARLFNSINSLFQSKFKNVIFLFLNLQLHDEDPHRTCPAILPSPDT